MTRLFIRIFVGVLFILFAEAAIQNLIFSRQNESHNIQVVEEALGGGVRLARDSFAAFRGVPRDDMLRLVRNRFVYPVEIMPESAVPEYVLKQFSPGHDVVYHYGASGGMVTTRLRESDDFLTFGPLPEFKQPAQIDLLLGLGVVLMLAAAAIALILRPVARQFRLIENMAMAVAEGNFSARVDETQVSSTTALAQAFNNMAARTEALLRTQRELLQAVSHELRTPLARIQFAIDLIRTSSNSEERENRLQSMEDATEELDSLVGELLRYVRMETSEPILEFTDVLLLPLVREVIEKNAILFQDKTFHAGDELLTGGFVVRADRSCLERVIGNLVANAARHATSRIVIDASVSGELTTITVDDDGPGIAPGDRERAFEPFVRLDENPSGSGAGLGLALVRRITAHHGGRIYATESPLGGCRMSSVWPQDASSRVPIRAAKMAN